MVFGSVTPVLPSSTPSERIMLQRRIKALNHQIRMVNESVSSGAISRSEGKIRKVYLEGRKSDLTNNLARIRTPKVTYRPLKKYVSTAARPDSSYKTSVRPSRAVADYSAPPVFDYTTNKMKAIADTDLPGLPVLKPMNIRRQNEIRENRARNKKKELAQQNKIAKLAKQEEQRQAVAAAKLRNQRDRQQALNRKKAAQDRKRQQMQLAKTNRAQQKRFTKKNLTNLNTFVGNRMKAANKQATQKKQSILDARAKLKETLTQRKTTRAQHQMTVDAIESRKQADATRFRAHSNAQAAARRDREVRRFMQSGGR